MIPDRGLRSSMLHGQPYRCTNSGLSDGTSSSDKPFSSWADIRSPFSSPSYPLHDSRRPQEWQGSCWGRSQRVDYSITGRCMRWGGAVISSACYSLSRRRSASGWRGRGEGSLGEELEDGLEESGFGCVLLVGSSGAVSDLAVAVSFFPLFQRDD